MKFSIYLLCLTAFLISCNREQKETVTHITNPQILNSVNFKVGTYFIYQDSITLKTDSIWVTNSFRNGYAQDPVNTIEIMGYNTINNDSIQGLVITTSSDELFNGSNIKGGFNLISPSLYRVNYDLNKNYQLGNGYYFYPSYFDSILINGRYYYNVLESCVALPFKPNNIDSIALRTYYSLTEGLIKYSIKTDTSYRSWELLRSKIIR